jgi:hypothetical protein
MAPQTPSSEAAKSGEKDEQDAAQALAKERLAPEEEAVSRV